MDQTVYYQRSGVSPGSPRSRFEYALPSNLLSATNSSVQEFLMCEVDASNKLSEIKEYSSSGIEHMTEEKLSYAEPHESSLQFMSHGILSEL